jgi:hypothetical protein
MLGVQPIGEEVGLLGLEELDRAHIEWTKGRLFPVIDPNAKPPRHFCPNIIAARRSRTRQGKVRHFLRWAVFPPPSQLRLTYPRIHTRLQVWLYYFVSVKDSIRYLLYDIHFNKEEKERIAFEAWCSSR